MSTTPEEQLTRLANKMRDRRIVVLSAFFLLVFAAVLLLNFAQPLFTDDWEYSFVYRLFNCENKGTVTDDRIASIADIFHSQYVHYFEWGGRSVTHVIAQLLLYMGAPLNKIVNSLAFVFLIFILCQFIKKRSEVLRLTTPLLVTLLLFFTIPVLGSTILWITGSANYLWGTLILLLFLLPYKNFYEVESESRSQTYFKAIYLFIGGIIAGWTNENTVATAIFILLCFLIYLKKTKTSIPLWVYTGIVGLIIGFCFMILAPGNFVRYQVSIEEAGLVGTSRIGVFISQFLGASSGLLFYLLPIIFIYFLLLIIYKYYGNRDCKRTSLSLSFFVAAILATLAMSFAPSFPERAWFGIICLAIVAIGILYNNLNFDIKALNIIRSYCLLFFGVAMLGLYISGYKDLSRANRVFEQRAKYIEEQKAKGVTDIVFKREIKSKSRINNVYDLTDDPSHWTNCFYARFYEINSVVVK